MNHSKSLAFLLSGIAVVDPDSDAEIHGLSIDSRLVKPGYLFVAYPGEKTDGRNYIEEAIKAGASAILAEENLTIQQDTLNFVGAFPLWAPVNGQPQKIAIITAKNIQHKISQIAARFYEHPSRQMHITGITGTNGKTSIAYLLSCAFNQLNVNNVNKDKSHHEAHKAIHNNTSIYFGTLGTGFPDALQESTHTTLDPIHLQQYLAKFLKKQVTHATLEVSSHALEQGRVAQIEFETAVFTNLTRDHLDYHKTMEAYGESKAKLFKQFGLKSVVINWDDSFGFNLYESVKDSIFKIGYSLNNPKADIYADNIKYSHEGIQANITTPWGDGILKTPLIGRFNLYNILAVVGVLGLSYPLEKVLTCIEKLPHVPGRMQCLSVEKTETIQNNNFHKPLLIVDYAHTPDALKNVLQTAKNLTQETGGELWCVFGCGGDRDKGKRPEMGKIGTELADYAIITNDNPRSENPEQIAEDILAGIAHKIKANNLVTEQLKIILDREEAITYAFNHAKPNDIILIAGKGHEPYQIIGEDKNYFSDEAVGLKLLNE